jgi:hypothetical protein
MSKGRIKEARGESSRAREEEGEEPLLSGRAWLLFAALVALGVAVLAIRAFARDNSALGVLNGKQVKVECPKAGWDPADTRIKIEGDTRPYLDLLGECHQRPQTLDIFRRALTEGTRNGRVLACHMAFYLAQDGLLKREDLGRIADLLEKGQDAEVRWVAQ